MAILSFRANCVDENGRGSTSFVEEELFEEVIDEESVQERGINRYIMSVELALRREKAYVDKVGKLQHQYCSYDDEDPNPSVQVQAPPLNSNCGLDRPPPSENLPCLPQPLLQQPENSKKTLQMQPPESISSLPPPQLQQSYAKKTHEIQSQENLSTVTSELRQSYNKPSLQIQSSGTVSCLPPRQLLQSVAKQALHIQASENSLRLPAPQQRQSCAKETLQIQPSQNLSCLPQPQLQQSHAIQTPLQPYSENLSSLPQLQWQQSCAKETLQIQPSQNLSGLPRPQLQQSYAKQTLQIQPYSENHSSLPLPQLKQTLHPQSSENLSCIPPSQLRQSYGEQNRHIQPQENLSCLPQPQLHQSYAMQTLQIQSSQNISRIPQPQLKKQYKKQSLQKKPVNLFCKECQLACSSALTLRQHYKGRKHRSRLAELSLQRMKHIEIQNTGQNIELVPFWCDVCQISCMNEHCYQEHLSGKKHIACVQALNYASSTRGEVGQTISDGRHGSFGVGGNFLQVNPHY